MRCLALTAFPPAMSHIWHIRSLRRRRCNGSFPLLLSPRIGLLYFAAPYNTISILRNELRLVPLGMDERLPIPDVGHAVWASRGGNERRPGPCPTKALKYVTSQASNRKPQSPKYLRRDRTHNLRVFHPAGTGCGCGKLIATDRSRYSVRSTDGCFRTHISCAGQ